MADIKQRIVLESVDNTTRGMRSAQNRLNAFDRTLKRVQTTMMGFVGISIFTHVIQGISATSDAAVELDAKLRLMTKGTEDYNKAQKELVRISLESGSSLEANTILFTRMNKAIQSMGGTTETTLQTTAALSQGLRISGASTQESSSVIRQWSQAMSSGVLRGEEFNAVSENGARIIQALSESLGVSIGELRAMSKEGELTAKIVTDALLEQSKVLAEENAKLPLTIGRAIENIRTKWTLMMRDASGINKRIAESINSLAENFDVLTEAIGYAWDALQVAAVVKFSTYMTALGQKLVTFAGISASSILASSAHFDKLKEAIFGTSTVAAAAAAERARYSVTQRTLDLEELNRLRTKAAAGEAVFIKEKEQHRARAADTLANAKANLDAIKSSIARGVAAEKALVAEIIKEKELAILKQEKRIVSARDAAYKKQESVNNIKNKQGEINAEIVLIEQKIKADVHNKRAITNANALEVANRKLARASTRRVIAQDKAIIGWEKLNTEVAKNTVLKEANEKVAVKSGFKQFAAKEKLIQAEVKVNAALAKQNALLNANAKASFSAGVALKKLSSAQWVVIGQMGEAALASRAAAAGVGLYAKASVLATTALKRVASVMGWLTSAILGLPGIIAYVTYEILDRFIDWGVAVDVLIDSFHRARLALVRLFTYTPAGWLADWISGGSISEYLDEWEAELDKTLDTNIQAYAEYSIAVKAGYDSVEYHRKALEAETKQAELDRIQELGRLSKKKVDLETQLQDEAAERLKAHVALMNDIEESSESTLDSTVEKLEFESELRLRLLEENSEVELNLKIDTNVKIAEVSDQHFSDMITQYENFYADEIALTKQGTKENVLLQKELVTKVKELYDKRISNARDTINKLNDIEASAIGAVKSAKDKLKSIEDDHAQFMRKADGDRRAEWQKNADAQKLYSSNSSKLREADLLDQKGKGAEAQELRDDVRNDLKDLYDAEVKRSEGLEKGTLAELNARSNATNAMNLYKEATDDSIKAQEDAISNGETIAKNARDHVQELIDQMGEFEAVSRTAQQEINNINQELKDIEDVEIELDTDKIYQQIAAVDSKIKDLEQTVTVTIVEKRVKAPEEKQSGGLIRRADGGFIPRKDRVPGSGSGDKVKALLEPGEFIMRKSAVQKYGEAMMYRLNGGKEEDEPEKRQSGGMIGVAQRFAKGGRVNLRGDKNEILNDLLENAKVLKVEGSAFFNRMVLGGTKANLQATWASKASDKVLGALEKLRDAPISEVKEFAKTVNNAKSMYFYDPVRWSAVGSSGGSTSYKKQAGMNKFLAYLDTVGIKGFEEGGIIRRFAEGGSVPSKGGSVPSKTTDFRTIIQRFSENNGFSNIVQRFAEGGSVPGQGFGDTVKALLTPGEFVVKNSAVSQFGTDFLNSINRGIMPQRFAEGGLVGAETSGETVNINLNFGGQSSSGAFPKTDATMALLDELKRAGAGS